MNPLTLLTNHPFWGLLTLAVVLWYSTITIYVAIRGAADIRQMLKNLKQANPASEDEKKN